MKILVLNCGSSSLKFALIELPNYKVLTSGNEERVGINDSFITFRNPEGKKIERHLDIPNHTRGVEIILDILKEEHFVESFDEIDAIGHRLVHGAERFAESVRISPEVIAKLHECAQLAPLHNPAHLLGLRAAQSIFKGLPNVVVFDTAFHQTMPEHAYTYAVPHELYEKYGLRRYGAHGTSYRFVADETARFLGKDKKDLRMVIAHLGNGASITAVANGESRDTSMGLTPLEGLVMGTRSGDIDPSVFSFLAENANMTIAQITDMLNKKSGLLGLSGLSNDCRTIEEESGKGHPGAKLALDVFIYRLAKYIGSMAVAAGGLDVLVFTGGIGENSDIIRERVLGYLGFLGLKADHEANLKARFGNAGVITTTDSKAVAVVIPTNEELMIAHDTARLSGL